MLVLPPWAFFASTLCVIKSPVNPYDLNERFPLLFQPYSGYTPLIFNNQGTTVSYFAYFNKCIPHNRRYSTWRDSLSGVILASECCVYSWRIFKPTSLIFTAVEDRGEGEFCLKGASDSSL